MASTHSRFIYLSGYVTTLFFINASRDLSRGNTEIAVCKTVINTCLHHGVSYVPIITADNIRNTRIKLVHFCFANITSVNNLFHLSRLSAPCTLTVSETLNGDNTDMQRVRAFRRLILALPQALLPSVKIY